MGHERQEGFVTEAERLLDAGKPDSALEMLYRYSDNAFAPRDAHYWRLRATCLEFLGKSIDAVDCLSEVGGADEKFLTMYIEGVKSLARRRRPIWWTRFQHRRHDAAVTRNIGYVSRLASQLGHDGALLKGELLSFKQDT